MKTVSINNQTYNVDDIITDFSIVSKPSSNVAFYGINGSTGELFVQFKNGSSYIYTGITSDLIIGLINCESIGSYISKNVVGQFASRKIAYPVITSYSPQEF